MPAANPLDEVRMAGIVERCRRRASHGVHHGLDSEFPYIRRCKYDDDPSRTRIIYTRDSGHHSSGWMRNPDYERCLHLSLSPKPFMVKTIYDYAMELDKSVKAAWVRAFFGDDVRYVWAESPKTPEGKRLGVWHWRLFCDEAWKPILPRGEVYSSEFTEKGWRSASQVLAEDGILITSPIDPT